MFSACFGDPTTEMLSFTRGYFMNLGGQSHEMSPRLVDTSWQLLSENFQQLAHSQGFLRAETWKAPRTPLVCLPLRPCLQCPVQTLPPPVPLQSLYGVLDSNAWTYREESTLNWEGGCIPLFLKWKCFQPLEFDSAAQTTKGTDIKLSIYLVKCRLLWWNW